MLPQLKAKKKGWILTVTTCPQFGLRAQIDVSKTAIKKHGSIDNVKELANQESAEKNRPIAFVNFDGDFIFKSDNWPK